MDDETSIHWDQDSDGVVTLTLDAPGRTVNTYDERFEADFGAVIDRLVAERATVRGVVLTSAKRSFFAGGDLNDLLEARAEDADRLHDSFTRTKARLRTLETLGVPVVAALNGAALGGGFEIALACHRRIALNDRRTTVGLPEVTFGLLPGGGGVVRTVRLLGTFAALQTVLLTGRAIPAAEAMELGLVDQLVDDPSALISAAREWVLANRTSVALWDVEGYEPPGARPSTPAFWAAVAPLVGSLRKSSRGAPAAAPVAIAAAATEGAALDFDTASEVETRYFVELVIGQESKNRIQGSFMDMNAVRAGAGRPLDVDEFRVQRLGVVGAGMMGAGIAYQAASRGIDVVIRDVSIENASKGREYSERVLAKRVQRGQLSQEAADEVLGRITATDDLDALAGSEAVIEAVFENPALKMSIFAEIEQRCPGALIASNTSTLPISDLATGLDDPSMFIGMHFFSPVDRMPPVEIVVGRESSDVAVARAMDLAKQLGKLPIVVNDGRGFFTSRVIGTYLDEAVAMLAEGAPAASVEQAAAQAGYPVGPLKLLDETGFRLPRTVRQETKAATVRDGGLWVDHPAAEVMDVLIEELGRDGRASGGGFYEYDDGVRTHLWGGLGARFNTRPDAVPFSDMVERLLFSEALETVRCFDDGVLRSFADANVGSVLAIGYPAWTGGVAQYIDGYPGGAAGFVERARELATAYGPRFTPPQSLVDRSRTGAYRAE